MILDRVLAAPREILGDFSPLVADLAASKISTKGVMFLTKCASAIDLPVEPRQDVFLSANPRVLAYVGAQIVLPFLAALLPCGRERDSQWSTQAKRQLEVTPHLFFLEAPWPHRPNLFFPCFATVGRSSDSPAPYETIFCSAFWSESPIVTAKMGHCTFCCPACHGKKQPESVRVVEGGLTGSCQSAAVNQGGVCLYELPKCEPVSTPT